MSELSGADQNDAPAPEMLPVVDGLRGLDPFYVKDELDREYEEKHAVDPKAGIIIAKLSEAGGTVVDGQTYHYFGGRILPVNPRTPNFENPRVHSVGQEPYLILDGTGGEMNTGTIVDDKVVWDEPHPVEPGELVVVQENQVHSLHNTGGTSFDFAFACPESHLVDRTLETPHGDRMFTGHLDNPFPPQYPLPAA